MVRGSDFSPTSFLRELCASVRVDTWSVIAQKLLIDVFYVAVLFLSGVETMRLRPLTHRIVGYAIVPDLPTDPVITMSLLHRSRSGSARAMPGLVSFVMLMLSCASAVGADGAQIVNDYLNGVSALEADFKQYTFTSNRSKMMEADGKFYLQRPGKFRWEYVNPYEQVIIADGKRVYLHDVELDQVSHQSQSKALRGTPALLLSNDDPVERHFSVRTIDSSDGRDWVELRPLEQDSEVLQIELGFKGNQLDSMIMKDTVGQETRLNFTGIKRNPALASGLFRFEEGIGGDFLQFD